MVGRGSAAVEEVMRRGKCGSRVEPAHGAAGVVRRCGRAVRRCSGGAAVRRCGGGGGAAVRHDTAHRGWTEAGAQGKRRRPCCRLVAKRAGIREKACVKASTRQSHREPLTALPLPQRMMAPRLSGQRKDRSEAHQAPQAVSQWPPLPRCSAPS